MVKIIQEQYTFRDMQCKIFNTTAGYGKVKNKAINAFSHPVY